MKRPLLLGLAILIAPTAARADIAVLANGTTFRMPEAAFSGYVPDEIVEEVAAAVAAASGPRYRDPDRRDRPPPQAAPVPGAVGGDADRDHGPGLEQVRVASPMDIAVQP